MIPPKIAHAADCDGTVFNHRCWCMPAAALYARVAWVRARLRTAWFALSGGAIGSAIGYAIVTVTR